VTSERRRSCWRWSRSQRGQNSRCCVDAVHRNGFVILIRRIGKLAGRVHGDREGAPSCRDGGRRRGCQNPCAAVDGEYGNGIVVAVRRVDESSGRIDPNSLGEESSGDRGWIGDIGLL